MKLTFKAQPESNMKIDKDGASLLTMRPIDEDIDLNELRYFHQKLANLHVHGARKDLNCSGTLQEINIKSEVTLKFQVLSEVDLNVVYALCRDPEQWDCKLWDEQKDLGEFQEEQN